MTLTVTDLFCGAAGSSSGLVLEPDEIKRGVAFDDRYLLLGNRREQVRLGGDAVTPRAAHDRGAAVVEALTGRGAG